MRARTCFDLLRHNDSDAEDALVRLQGVDLGDLTRILRGFFFLRERVLWKAGSNRITHLYIPDHLLSHRRGLLRCHSSVGLHLSHQELWVLLAPAVFAERLALFERRASVRLGDEGDRRLVVGVLGVLHDKGRRRSRLREGCLLLGEKCFLKYTLV